MNTITIRQVITLVIIFQTLLLTGCLAKDKPDAGFVGNGSPEHNSPPTISGNPQTAVMMGDSYSFTPTASDPDGDTLTFSIQNKPVWADFNDRSGEISGTPTLGDLGIYSNIAISVSDGSDTASLPEFAVSVDQIGTISTTLSWIAPLQNNDGSQLSDLAGFKIYYGQLSGVYTNEIVIDNPSVSTYVIDNLTPATYYFVATAVNSQGIESDFSAETPVNVN